METRNLNVTGCTCEICNKVFTKFNAKSNLNRHQVWCKKKEDFIRKYSITNEMLKTEYQRLGSVLEFQKEYPHWDNFSHYYRIFKEFSVKISIKTSKNNEKVKENTRKSHMKKYGVPHNFSAEHPSRKKWEKRLFDEEGITNVFQRESVKVKSINTIVEKYGKELWLHAVTVRGAGVVSKLNIKVFDILTENKIKFTIEHKVKREKGKYFSYDILLEENKIIEVNGDYWHGNPKIYKADDIILKGSTKEIIVKDKWEFDKNKLNFIENLGYKTLVIWEYDLKHCYEETILKIIEYAKS